MAKLQHSCLHFCIRFIEYISAALFILLALSSFLGTAYVEDAYQIPIILSWDNPVWNLLFLILYLGLIFLVAKLFEKLPKGNVILLIISCFWVFAASILWVWLSKSGPASDCGSVYYAAKQFARNDFSSLSYRDSYFSCYPFQLGLAFFYEIIFRLVRNDNFHILQGVNAVCLVIITISQYHLTALFLEKDPASAKKAQLYGLFLTCSCLPLIMYGSYIYGEIPSFAFLLFGSWMILLFLKKQNILCGILALPSLALAMLVRQNTLIFLIALGIILVLFFLKRSYSTVNAQDTLEPAPSAREQVSLEKSLSTGALHSSNKEKHRHTIIFQGAYLLLVFLISLQMIPWVQQSYASRSGTQINKGVSTSSYLAMGLMEGPACPGGYNGYNFDTFTVTADYDHAVASQIGMEAYQEKLTYFASHPLYSLQFLGVKFLDQWLNAGWAIFDSTYVSFGERFPLIESCFSGSMYDLLIAYMSNQQMVLYLLTAIFCIQLLRQKPEETNIFSLVFLLTAFGGALFYLAWEASGRYILPYGILILPNAAMGLVELKRMVE